MHRCDPRVKTKSKTGEGREEEKPTWAVLGRRGAEILCDWALRPLKCGLLGADASVKANNRQVLHRAYEVRADLGGSAEATWTGTTGDKLEVQRVWAPGTVACMSLPLTTAICRFALRSRGSVISEAQRSLLLCLDPSRARQRGYICGKPAAIPHVHASVLSVEQPREEPAYRLQGNANADAQLWGLALINVADCGMMLAVRCVGISTMCCSYLHSQAIFIHNNDSNLAV